DGAVSVLVSASGGSASSGTDYLFTPIRVSFAAGESVKSVSVRILPDALVEGNETFYLVLSDPLGGGQIGTSAQSAVTITDDDVALPLPSTIQFAPASYLAGEASGSVVVVVTRNGDTSGAASVRYGVTGGSATSGEDYVAVTGVLDFSPGQPNRTIV